LGHRKKKSPDGKKQEGANAAANAATDSNVPDAPTDTPKEKKILRNTTEN